MTRHYEKYGMQIKELAKALYLSQETPVAISQALGIPYGTVKNWCRKIDLNIDLNEEHRGGPHNVRITHEISRYIVESLDNENWITISKWSNC